MKSRLWVVDDAEEGGIIVFETKVEACDEAATREYTKVYEFVRVDVHRRAMKRKEDTTIFWRNAARKELNRLKRMTK